MNMDSSSSSSSSAAAACHDHNNWLAFSLSNHSQQHQRLSLFQTPTPTPTPTPSSILFNSSNCGGDVLSGDQENGISAGTDAARDQPGSVLGGGDQGQKLEDFLSGCGGAAADGVAHGSILDMYDDAELKAIAASFLCGFSNDQITQKRQAEAPPPEPPAKKAADTFGQRTSIFRGVTRHRWTGRYEAHLWDNSCRREGQSRKGRQVYLGGYDKEEKAARAYDLAAIKYWGPTTTTNFPVEDYGKEMEEMKNMTRQEFVASLRRKSSGFSRGASIYRGVTRHHQHGRWQARIGRVAGNKDLYLGTFSTQEEAAEAYDIAAIKFRGLNAVTNFDISRYDVKSIACSNLPIGGVNNTISNNNNNKSTESLSENKSVDGAQSIDNTTKDVSSAISSSFPLIPSPPTLNFTLPLKQDHHQSSNLWTALGYNQNPNQAMVTNNPNGTTPYSMEYNPMLSNHVISNNEGFLHYYQHPLEESGSGTSSGSGINEDNSKGTTHDAGALGFGINWNVSPSTIQEFQPEKPGISTFQTPIFGLE